MGRFDYNMIPFVEHGIDDDGDGLVDLADPGCSSVADPRELSMDEELPQCSDGIDNDGDGNIDFPYDPGCGAAGDNEEVNPPNAPECGDELDNDNDGDVLSFEYRWLLDGADQDGHPRARVPDDGEVRRDGGQW